MRVCRVTVLAFCGEDGFEQKWETGVMRLNTDRDVHLGGIVTKRALMRLNPATRRYEKRERLLQCFIRRKTDPESKPCRDAFKGVEGLMRIWKIARPDLCYHTVLYRVRKERLLNGHLGFRGSFS